MNTAVSKKHKDKETVASYINKAIGLSGRSQIEIAEIAGFPKPNVISMIKSGKIALPMGRVAGMARALNVDPLHLYKLAMAEYEPEVWRSIEGEILRQPMLTVGERELIETLREAQLKNYRVATEEQKAAVIKMFSKYVEQKKIHADQDSA